jgi:hypothetical protein
MHENTQIANQPKVSPAALDNINVPVPELSDLEPGLNQWLPIQLKLAVGAPDDPLEYEADAMADKVMRMPETSFIQRKSACSCGDYDDEHVRLKPLASQITPFIQAKGNGAGAVSDAVSGKIQSSMGGGSPMQANTKSFMESRFGTDFSDVKIHNGGESTELNRSLDAKAFTVSNNIYFNSGQYQPETDSGKHLLAHELTHTIQQSGSKGAGSSAVIRRTPEDDAKALAKKIHDAISAVKADEGAVLTALGTLGRDATKAALLKTIYKTEHTTELEADIKLKLSAANSSRALFLLNAPPAETTLVTEATVEKAGTEAHTAKAGGGDISIHTDVDYKPTEGGPTRTGGFSVGFSGAKSSETRFIQTIWSEIIVTNADKTETRVNKSGLPESNGTMDLTTDITKPKYKIDSGSTTSPFYEPGGRNVRTAGGNVNYDRPGEFADIILKQFDAGATKVVEKDHFDNFLIQEEKVLYQASLYVEWIYTSKTAIARSTKFGSGAAITALPAEVRKQLIKEYPKFEYIS